MKVIYRKRQTGRTKELLDIAEQTGATIVCHSLAAAEGLFARAGEEGREIKKPIPTFDLMNHYREMRTHGTFLIDNLDLCLSSLFPGVEIASVVLEDTEDHSDDPHVLVSEYDGVDEYDSLLAHEQYIGDGRGSLSSVRDIQKRIGKRFGNTWIARLVYDEGGPE